MKIVSLFSGCGGLDLGFRNAGFEIIWANDIFEDAAKTYARNIGKHISTQDIATVAIEEIPNCDGIIGGFPCQGFSIANWGRKVNDSRNKMYLEFVRVLRGKQPKFFIAENVKGILTLGKGKVFEKIKEDFGSVGYDINYKLFNCANYGVPQKRERVIIFGTRVDITPTLKISFPPSPTHVEDVGLFKETKSWVSCGEALRHIPEPSDNCNLANHSGSNFKLKFNNHIGHRRIDPQKPAPTITARGDEKGGAVIIHHPNNTRRMTVRETASIQTFPLDFFFEGSNTSGYRQIGNAVPPLFAEQIAKSVIATFSN